MAERKLTAPRREVLDELAGKDRPIPFSASYPPIKWLLAQGYVEEREGRYSNSYAITKAGRAALTSPESRDAD